ncbi:methyl-accepting chemotaxis protein [Bacillus sp. RO2]|jgi:methyl-accepting chemotaxis protein|uniref:methyl-accepting chemotaxis protein n=1 Tax=Bacillus sp. RO2 TaxID=2723913 RepID=UPI00145FC128|nr:methyl-accepting chemotaxis protein [Bacillus sp. RO2]NMH72503.1 methyl-accepting chemotaxis protein [Bacillus sp. RO2]
MKTIRGRVRFILLTAITGLIIVLLFNFFFYFTQSTAKEQEAALFEAVNGSKEIKFAFSDTRKNEQEFLRVPSDETSGVMKENLENIKQEAAKMKKQFAEYEEIASRFAQIETAASDYMNEFVPLEELYKEIGYTEFTGLQGEMNGVIRNLVINVRGANREELNATLMNLRLFEQQYLATKQEARYRDFLKSAETFKEQLDATDLPDSQKNGLLELYNPYVQAMTDLYNNYNSSYGFIRSFEEISNGVEQSVNEVEAAVMDVQSSLQEESNRRLQTIMLLTLIISGLLLLFLSSTGYLLNRKIASSIRSLKDGASKIGEGNFAYRVPITTKDEMADLAVTFNSMAEKVQISLLKVMEATDKLQSSSQNLAAISEETTAQSTEVNEAIKQVAIGSSEQALHLDESTEILKRVKSAVELANQLSIDIKTKADHARTMGEDGLTVVKDLYNSSEQFLKLANHLTERVQQATKQSQQINSIVATIQEIAENTDLLALNAAIESARAGDAGRGFAVVAQEVRKLAERSKHEALSIKKLVTEMGKQMGKLSDDALQFNEYRDLQQESVNQTKTSFEKIAGNVMEINNKVDDVQEAIVHVTESNKQLEEKLSEVHYISEEAAATSEQVSASSEHQIVAIEQVNEAAISLSDIANELQEEVSQFTVEGEKELPVEEFDHTDENLQYEELKEDTVSYHSDDEETQKENWIHEEAAASIEQTEEKENK